MSSSNATKLPLYSSSDLKTTLDDHITVYLSTAATPSSAPLPRHLRFTPSETHTYIRLGLGYSAVAIAVYLFYLDYIVKVDFREIKQLTLWSVVVYFILNTALQAWIWLGEKGVIFIGERRTELVTPPTASAPDGRKKKSVARLEVFSRSPSKKYDPIYRIAVTWHDASVDLSNSVGKDSTQSAKEKSLSAMQAVKEGTQNNHGQLELEAPLMKFFTEDGYFAPAAFEEWLRDEIPVIEGREPSEPGASRSASKQSQQLASSSTSVTTSSSLSKASKSTVTNMTITTGLGSGVGAEEEDMVVIDSPSTGSAKKRSTKKRA